MSNSSGHNEKLLKIFAGVRCLNKDQLPRYLDGRLTNIEKHLVEQHLVDCDLCFEALQVLQQERYRDQYPALAGGIQQYIRDSIRPVSQLHQMERYLRKVKKRENMLIYFWVAAFIVLGAGAVYVAQQYDFKRPASSRPVARVMNAAAAVPSAAQHTDSHPPARDAQPVILAAANPVNNTPAPNTAAAATKPATPVTPAAAKPAPAKKDSVKKQITDSAKKAATATKAPDTLKKTPDKATAKQAKDTPAAPVAQQPSQQNGQQPKEPDSSRDKPAATAPSEPASTDEYLYKAAMVYQRQGDLNEAISRYKRLASSSEGRYGEMARYQLAVCYRDKGQTGKARRMFKEVVRMNGNMKEAAQQALDNL